MLWLCVYFPRLGLEVCQPDSHQSIKTAPHPTQRPTVLLANNRVMQRNGLAQQRGIHIGTSLAAAHSIATDLCHFQRNPGAENKRLTYLAQILYGFSSHVCVDSTPGGYLDYPDNVHHSVLLEISASLTLFEGLQNLARRIIQQMAELRHEARLQVAVTPLAALCGARWQQHNAQPDGCVTHDNPPKVLDKNLQALHAMPLSCLAISERDGESLHNMGLHTCGALLRLPPKELGQRFGSNFNSSLDSYLQRLTGASPDPRRPIEPPRRFTSSTHLLDACTSKTALLLPIKRLCHEFSRWLIAQQLGVCLLRWQFANHNDAASTLDVRTTRASQSGALLLSLTQLQLERCELPRDVLDIHLASVELEPWENHSDNLFSTLLAAPEGDTRQASLTDLLDKLRARLGPDVCTGLHEQSSHRPEQAWEAAALTHITRTPTSNTPERANSLDSIKGKHRPLWLLPQPTPVAGGDLKLMYGPERLQGGWWQNERLRRDYYIAQTRNQQRHGGYSWVYREREQWFVHGYFG